MRFTFEELVNHLYFWHEDSGQEYYTRAEMTELVLGAINALTQCFSCGVDAWDIGEDFYVHNDLWRTYGVEGVLCIECFETRLGRKLTSADFKDGFTGAQVRGFMSDRLRDRITGK